MKTAITPNAHEKAEWARMAQDAYRLGRNEVGHRYSTAAAQLAGMKMATAYFNALQRDYRAWLIDGFKS